jgi:hypothetical protein
LHGSKAKVAVRVASENKLDGPSTQATDTIKEHHRTCHLCSLLVLRSDTSRLKVYRKVEAEAAMVVKGRGEQSMVNAADEARGIRRR